MIDQIGTSARRLLLDGDDWTLTYCLNPRPGHVEDQRPPSDYASIRSTVPGSIELDFVRANELGEPFEKDNIRQVWALEDGDWWFRKEFDLPDDWVLDQTVLMLHGVDTIAEVFLNDVSIGRPRNMFVAHELATQQALRHGKNELLCHIISPIVYAETCEFDAGLWQAEETLEGIHVRKPGHMYGWDIAPRMVSAGLHRSVELVRRPQQRVCNWYLRTHEIDVDARTAILGLNFELGGVPRDSAVLEIEAIHQSSGAAFAASVTPSFKAGHVEIGVEDARFWFPRNYGQPDLYDVTLRLVVNGQIADVHDFRFGIRKVEIDHVRKALPDGRFALKVNGRPVMVMGTNWVPLDAIHARDAERMERALSLLWECGCNLVRCWGGNLYEDTPFFDWCDSHGVMVWQDFGLACARYPQTDAFASELRDEASEIIAKLRNHPSLALWCGSNENDEMYERHGLDPETDILTRSVLPAEVRRHDPHRPYISGSPDLYSEVLKSGKAKAPEQHLWGARAWYKAPFYANTEAMFVSEVGFHGCPSPDSLTRYLGDLPETLPIDDPVWRLHETIHSRVGRERPMNRLQLMSDQATLLFGSSKLVLGDFAIASQLSQAEALKFFIETTRIGKGKRWGVIWWNLLDCWPQISDAVVDYYFEKKLAFHFVRNSQQPLCLIAGEADGWHRPLVLANDGGFGGKVACVVQTADGNKLLQREVTVAPFENVVVGQIPIAIGETRCLILEWETAGNRQRNHYIDGFPPFNLAQYRNSWLPQILRDESMTRQPGGAE